MQRCSMDIIPGYELEEEHYDILQLTMVHCRFIEEEQTVDIQLTVVNASSGESCSAAGSADTASGKK